MEGLTEKETVEEIIFYFILLFLSYSPPYYRISVPNQALAVKTPKFLPLYCLENPSGMAGRGWDFKCLFKGGKRASHVENWVR